MKNGLTTDKYGTKWWYLDGKQHRIDGPAVEWADGAKLWFLHGKQHRVDGPAEEWASGTKRWYLHDKLVDCQTQEQFIRLMNMKGFW